MAPPPVGENAMAMQEEHCVDARTQVRGVIGGFSAPDANAPVVEWDDADVATEWIGRVIGKRYRIISHIASGGMGHVFIAQHTALGGYVAVKILLAGSDETSARYFRNEARCLSRLRHPNIVSAFDYAMMRSGDAYIVMEWIPGYELGTFIATHGSLDAKRVLWLTMQLASAIDHVHSHGVLHRDIKPDNVVFSPAAHDLVKLLDFGVAIPVGKPPEDERGKLIGTPLYMAPEQASGLPSSASTDLYALGAVTLELLTGHAPYDRLGPAETIRAVLTKAPFAPSDSGLHVVGLDAVMAHALARDPRERFQTGLAFVLALRHVLRSEHSRIASITPRSAAALRLPLGLRGTVMLPFTDRSIRMLRPIPELPKRVDRRASPVLPRHVGANQNNANHNGLVGPRHAGKAMAFVAGVFAWLLGA